MYTNNTIEDADNYAFELFCISKSIILNYYLIFIKNIISIFINIE